MPWLPEFVSAVELARVQTRADGRSDPVGQYVAALNSGDTHLLEDVWPAEVVVYDPRAGEVRGHRQLREFVKRSQGILADRAARIETLGSFAVPGRAVVELLAHLSPRSSIGPAGDPAGDPVGDQEVAWPIAIVAESTGDRSVVFRSYFSERPLDGQAHVRPPILPAGPEQPGGVVGQFQAALSAGDTDAVVGAFTPDGYFREPAGPGRVHRGSAELRSFFGARFGGGGGIDLEPCAVIDDGARCALEYNFVRRGDRELPPQAGIAVYELDPAGLLAAARGYDDVQF
jgi:limonene-1,2-epoxide hydrolase